MFYKPSSYLKNTTASPMGITVLFCITWTVNNVQEDRGYGGYFEGSRGESTCWKTRTS